MVGVAVLALMVGQKGALGAHPAIYVSKRFGLQMSYPRSWKVLIEGDKRPSWSTNPETADLSSCVLFQLTDPIEFAPEIKIERNTDLGVRSLREAMDLWSDSNRRVEFPVAPELHGKSFFFVTRYSDAGVVMGERSGVFHLHSGYVVRHGVLRSGRCSV